MVKKNDLLERRSYSKGQIIFREGDMAGVAYLIQMGSVEVYREINEQKINLATLSQGEIIGEAALLDSPNTRTANVAALEDTNVVVIRQDVFQQKLENSDPTIRAVLNMLTKRMVQSNEAIVNHKNISLEKSVTSLHETIEVITNAIPDDMKEKYKQEAYPLMRKIVSVMEKFQREITKRSK